MANLRANRITSTEVFETTGSVYLTDPGNQYLSIANSGDSFVFGTGDFTIEGWFYINSSGSNNSVYDFRDSSSFNHYLLRMTSSTAYDFRYLGTSLGTFTAAASTWNHIAVARQSGTTKIFVNGVQTNSFSDTNNASSSEPILISTFTNSKSTSDSKGFDGYVSNFRVLKGQALYTENFTPPTRELEVIPNTVLLACQSTTNAAEEKTGKTITVNGNAVANELTPGLLTNIVKSGGSSAITGSVEFDGTGDYLDVGNSNDFSLSGQKFTVEFWVYPTEYSQGGGGTESRTIVGKWDGPGIPQGWRIDITTSSVIWYTAGIIHTTPITLNQWTHIAAIGDGSNTSFYKNGVLVSGPTANTWTDTTTSKSLLVGALMFSPYLYYLKGFISNLRIIKGTALYTSNFIPPTRKLTKLPGTVLLCCQDSNDPTTEATGKTITGYGDLQKADGVELVTNGSFTSTDDWTQGGTNATIGSGVLSLSGAVYNTDYQQQVLTFNIYSTYVLTFDILNYSSGGVQIDIVGQKTLISTGVANSNGSYRVLFTPPTNSPSQTFRVSGNGTLQVDNVSVTLYDPPNRASDFTPSVGSDGSVEFAGPTTINTENYFYLPTGPTEQRSRGRGVFGGGSPIINTIEYINISTQGNAIDFGDMSASAANGSGLGSSTRGVFGGFGSPIINTIEYITFSTTSNSLDFGDLTTNRWGTGSTSNNTRGIFYAGYNPATTLNVTKIDYITIATLGSAATFGDATTAYRLNSGCGSSTRGIFAGGVGGTSQEIEYITLSTLGNSVTFGNLSQARFGAAASSSSTRAIFSGGYENPGPALTNLIDYVTIATTGNTQDFGDLTRANWSVGGTSNSIRGVVAGGYVAPVRNNTIDYVTIASTGNAQDFGDMTSAKSNYAAFSDSHGGLG